MQERRPPPPLGKNSQLPLDALFALTTVDGRVLTVNVVGDQPLELLVNEFEAVVRATTCRFPM